MERLAVAPVQTEPPFRGKMWTQFEDAAVPIRAEDVLQSISTLLPFAVSILLQSGDFSKRVAETT